MAALTHGLLFFVTEPVPSLQVMMGELKHYSSIYNLKIKSEMGIVLPLTVRVEGEEKFPFKVTKSYIRYLGSNIPVKLRQTFALNFSPLMKFLS